MNLGTDTSGDWTQEEPPGPWTCREREHLGPDKVTLGCNVLWLSVRLQTLEIPVLLEHPLWWGWRC